MLNENRVKTFATLLKAVASPLFLMELEKSKQEIDWAEIVRAIATVVPEPTFIPLGGSIGGGSIGVPLAPYTPNVGPLTPYSEPTTVPWNPQGGQIWMNGTGSNASDSYKTLCSAMTDVGLITTPSAMTQADGMGDNSGFRGD